MCPFHETVPRKTNYAPNEKKKKNVYGDISVCILLYHGGAADQVHSSVNRKLGPNDADFTAE